MDATTSIVLEHPGGAHGLVTTSLEAAGANAVSISGTEARVVVEPTWYRPAVFSLIARDGTVLERFDEPHQGGGLRHQAEEVARCLRDGRVESEVMPLDETLSIMRTLDEVRRQIGLVYPPTP